MAKPSPLILPNKQNVAAQMGVEPIRPALPKVKGVRPFGSKILVEVLRDDEIMGTSLYVGAGAGTGAQDGAPQAVIIKLGSGVPADAGLSEGQRIYWTGKGTMVSDPTADPGRTRALLEIHNIIAILEEDK